MTLSYAASVSQETGGELAVEIGAVIDKAHVNMVESLYALAVVAGSVLQSAPEDIRPEVLARFYLIVRQAMRE